MEKIYLVATEETYDFEILTPSFEVFRMREDAEKCFKNLIDQFKEEYEELKDGDWEIEKDAGHWCAYEPYNYTKTHVIVRLEEVEVK